MSMVYKESQEVRIIRDYKRKRWKNVAVAGLIIIVTTSCALTILEYCGWKKCLYEKNELEEQLNSYRHMVYVAAEKLPKGTVLTEEKLNREVKYFNLQNINFITEDAIGKTMALDVAEGTCLTSDMLCTETENMREIFLSNIFIQDYIKEGDRIDVRIRFDNAEDYIVLADKILKRCETGKGIVLELTEEEILFISSAFADSEMYDGTELYIAKYPEYKQTVTSEVNYIATMEILALLGRENTEGEIRTALEKRLMRKR